MKPENLSGALRTVLNILDAWSVPDVDRLALLGCDIETYERWLKTRELGATRPDTLERLSYILGIYRALHILFPADTDADTWIHRSNAAPEFDHQTPLSIMAQGQIEHLAQVRRFLDSWLD